MSLPLCRVPVELYFCKSGTKSTCLSCVSNDGDIEVAQASAVPWRFQLQHVTNTLSVPSIAIKDQFVLDNLCR